MDNSILELRQWFMDIQKHPYSGLFPLSNVQMKHILEAALLPSSSDRDQECTFSGRPLRNSYSQ
jgi:hypothetical protein